MTKDKLQDYSTTESLNSDVGGTDVSEGCSPGGLNDALRKLMAHVKTALSGSDDKIITGTAGTDGNLSQWNADGDLVDGPAKSGADAAVITGTAGADGNLAQWNTDGDAVDSGLATSAIAMRYIDSVTITSSTISAAKDIPSGYTQILIEFEEYEPATNGAVLSLRVGTAGAGGSFLSSSSYVDQFLSAAGGTVSGAAATDTLAPLTSSIQSGTPASRGFGHARLRGFNTSGGRIKGEVFSGGVNVSGINAVVTRFIRNGTTGDYNAIQFLTSNGNIANLTAHIYGIKNA